MADWGVVYVWALNMSWKKLKERQGDQLHFTLFSIDGSVKLVIQYYPNLQAKLAYCCFIHPGRRHTFTGSEAKDLLLTVQQAGWDLVWVRFSVFSRAIYLDLAGWLCQWVCVQVRDTALGGSTSFIAGSKQDYSLPQRRHYLIPQGCSLQGQPW